jgi:preprotein translocase subunit YajC
LLFGKSHPLVVAMMMMMMIMIHLRRREKATKNTVDTT